MEDPVFQAVVVILLLYSGIGLIIILYGIYAVLTRRATNLNSGFFRNFYGERAALHKSDSEVLGGVTFILLGLLIALPPLLGVLVIVLDFNVLVSGILNSLQDYIRSLV